MYVFSSKISFTYFNLLVKGAGGGVRGRFSLFLLFLIVENGNYQELFSE